MAGEQSRVIAGLIERTGRLLGTDSHADGLLPVHWEALRYLNKANQFSRTHTALTVYLGLTKGTVSQTLKALEGKGLVQKEVDLRDRRSIHLTLTRSGLKHLERDPLNSWEEQLEALSKADRRGLERGLSSLLKRRLNDQDRSPFGLCQECVYFLAQHTDGAPHFCDLLKAPLSSENASLICVEQIPTDAIASH